MADPARLMRIVGGPCERGLVARTPGEGDPTMPFDDYLYCPECADYCAAEIPDCPDGHGRDCPERACAACGTALLVDPLARRRSRRVPAHAA
jgi:hypothetical protein